MTMTQAATANTDLVVSVRNAHKAYGALPVLRDLSFDVERGGVTVLIGRSGSGKSTALRCLNRLEKINSGRIEVCGHRLESAELNLRALRMDVGIVFQSYNLFPHLTLLQNVMLAPRSVRGMSKQDAGALAREVLARVGLGDKLANYPDQLSGGQQQRGAIARSLAMNPKLLLLDEVTSALDPELTGEVLKVLEDLAARGMSMVLVTHEMQFARRAATQVVFMHEGAVGEAGSPLMMDRPQTSELKRFLNSELAN